MVLEVKVHTVNFSAMTATQGIFPAWMYFSSWLSDSRSNPPLRRMGGRMILLRQGLDAPNSGLRLGSKTSSLEFIMEASQRLTNIKTVAFHMMERVLALVAILLNP